MADKPQQTKRKLQRSAAYPGITLEKAIEATKQLRDNLGSGPYSRDSAATALGYSGVSGASVTKVSACVHFGLLTRTGNAYSQSPLADQLFRYISEEERNEATKAAALKPALYTKLVNEFDGRALPNMLDNLLVRNYGITERVAKDVANIFKKSIQFAGILNNGIITLGSTTPSGRPSDSEAAEEDPETDADPSLQSANPTTPVNPPQNLNPGYLTITIPNTDVKIIFPMSYAYDLSTGSFKEGIEALARSIKKSQVETVSDDKPATTA